MQGTIAQIVALVVHGNTYLSGSDRSEAFPNAHSTLTFCEFVKFVDLKRSGEGWSESPFAADPASWVERLRRDGVNAIRMVYLPSGESRGGATDRMLVGFVGGGGRWLLETTGHGGCDYWEARWEVGDQKRTDRRIWQVTYGRIATDQPSPRHPPVDLEGLKQRLAKNLTEISAFARHQKLDGFAKAFATGLSDLESASPGAGLYHSDISSPRLPLAADQLLSAAQSSWVFGGMGSWNDLGFDGDEQETYEHLSEGLYELLNESIVSAANSTAPCVSAHPQADAEGRSWWSRFWT